VLPWDAARERATRSDTRGWVCWSFSGGKRTRKTAGARVSSATSCHGLRDLFTSKGCDAGARPRPRPVPRELLALGGRMGRLDHCIMHAGRGQRVQSSPTYAAPPPAPGSLPARASGPQSGAAAPHVGILPPRSTACDPPISITLRYHGGDGDSVSVGARFSSGVILRPHRPRLSRSNDD
jgi:hypothetical protein